MRLSSFLPAFQDEIQKIASVRGRKEEEIDPHVGTKALAGGVAPVGTAMVAQKFLGNHIDLAGPNTLEEAVDRAGHIARKMKVTAPVEANFYDSPGMSWVNTSYDTPPKFSAHFPLKAREADVALEFGHVVNRTKLRPLPTKVLNFTRAAGMNNKLIPTAAGAIAAADPNASWTPGLVAAGMAAPTLLDEGAASARALKYMVGQHGLKKGLARSAHLAPAFASYAALGLAPLAITAGRRLWRKHKGKEKTAIATGTMAGGLIGAGLGSMAPGRLKPYAMAAGGALGALTGKAVSTANRALVQPGHHMAQPDPDYNPTWQQGYR